MKSFEISESAEKKLIKWQKKIKDKYGEYGSYIYQFQPTGLGTIIKVISTTSGKTLDLSEVEKW